MELERKFIWCVRYYNIKSRSASYCVFIDFSAREINEEVECFLKTHKDYIVRVFKNYKSFDYGQ